MDDEMGYGNFPWVITENQSQIPVWESQVKEKISSKSTSAFGTRAFWAYFLLSQVTLREEFGSDFLWSRMGNFHTPRVIRWGIAFLYSKRNRAWTLDHWEPSFLICKWDFTTEPMNRKFSYLLLVLLSTMGYDQILTVRVWPFPHREILVIPHLML